MRSCSRSACRQDAVATLTYVYADSTAVLGPLATFAEPHCYDLCADHARRLTVPRGWEVVRLALSEMSQVAGDELSALADAVREQRPAAEAEPEQATHRLRPPVLEPPTLVEGARRGHLRALRDPDEATENAPR